MPRPRRLPALGAIAAVVLFLAACAAPPAAGGAGSPGTAPIRWAPCPDLPGVECGSLEVPLDRADPAGGTVTLAAARLPARDPEHRIGSVVLHRGGPGYGTVDYLGLVAAGTLPAPVDDAVRDRYDVVAVDQRGTGRSGPRIDCGGRVTDPVAYPDSHSALTDRVARDDRVRARCAAGSGGALAHVSTVDAARDLDEVRASLGEERLDLVGQSYGTFLAVVYADLFPDRVGRFVLDSVIDAPGRAAAGRSTMSARTRPDVGTEETLTEFLDACRAGGPRCAFGGSDPAGALDRLLARLPATVGAKDPRVLTAPDVVGQIGALLYQPSTWRSTLAPFLGAVEQALTDPRGAVGDAVATGVAVRAAGDPTAEAVMSAFAAVTCSETAGPGTADEYAASVDDRTAMAPRFAALRAEETLLCLGWPARAAAPLPRLDAPIRTSGRVLLVNDRSDPATPLPGARATQRLLPGSSLLVVDGPGHVAAQQSRCSVTATSGFLVDGDLPADGTVCPPDRAPFAP
ncbi:alpha/beta hydrolase [Actinomycetospora termitidis]|uniref:Alpha/beta hydrolase n=1 Tax=Actinomycetospora termitidis TaxID=3053470 RepID=A0ABT7MH53_9PSEU|nr:alpha/beta hydrolase [Actinomycetospora sp. Odt1-22]MDL5160015.1 alpha/beta hydrolase [Actinomycetospora sp. Odt1-22]